MHLLRIVTMTKILTYYVDATRTGLNSKFTFAPVESAWRRPLDGDIHDIVTPAAAFLAVQEESTEGTPRMDEDAATAYL